MSKRYRYEKFEKLSDAFEAWEKGEDIFYYFENKPHIITANGECLTLHKGKEYYRRIEVKPLEFELELFKHEGILEMIKINGEYYSVYQLPSIHPNRAYKKTTIKMREVTE